MAWNRSGYHDKFNKQQMIIISEQEKRKSDSEKRYQHEQKIIQDEIDELKKYLNPEEWDYEMSIQDGTQIVFQFRKIGTNEKQDVVINHRQNFEIARKLIDERK